MYFIVITNRRANHNIAIKIPVNIRIKNTAAINGSTMRLEGFNDFHGGNFGGAGDGAAGEAIFKYIN